MLLHEKNRLKIIYQNPNITGTEHLNIEAYFTVDFPNNKFTIAFGRYVHIKKYCHIMILANARLQIGDYVFFNNYCSVNCLEKITIGKGTMFGEGVKIYDHNHTHSYVDGRLVANRTDFKAAPVSIGEDCWIGSNVTILPGVSIGNNVIIGANNLIYQSIPANTVVKANSNYNIETRD